MQASLAVEHTGGSILLLGIAGLDVHGNHQIEETELLVSELVDKPAVLQQLRVTMRKAWIVIVSGDIVGFECLLNSLMTEEGHVKPVASLE